MSELSAALSLFISKLEGEVDALRALPNGIELIVASLKRLQRGEFTLNSQIRLVEEEDKASPRCSFLTYTFSSNLIPNI